LLVNNILNVKNVRYERYKFVNAVYEIGDNYCAMDTKHIRTMCGQNSDNLNVKVGGHCEVSGVCSEPI